MAGFDALTSWAKTHKNTALGIGAVGTVGGFALYQRHKTSAATTGDAGTATSSTDGTSTSGYAYGTAGLTGTPDTSGTDIQNAVQDQLNAALDAIGQSGSSSASSTDPSTAQFYFGAAAQGLRYLRDRATGAVYQVGPTGVAYHVSPIQYAELNRPAYTDYGTAPKPKPKAVAKPQAAPKAAPKPKPKPVTAKAKPAVRTKTSPTYTVQRGDNLTKIAQEHKISLGALEAKNRQISNYNEIRPGQKIHL